jgi:hypothetical protein
LLVQGSVQPLGTWFRARWQQAMRSSGSLQFGINWTELKLEIELQERTRNLVSQKYSREEYKRKR